MRRTTYGVAEPERRSLLISLDGGSDGSGEIMPGRLVDVVILLLLLSFIVRHDVATETIVINDGFTRVTKPQTSVPGKWYIIYSVSSAGRKRRLVVCACT